MCDKNQEVDLTGVDALRAIPAHRSMGMVYKGVGKGWRGYCSCDEMIERTEEHVTAIMLAEHIERGNLRYAEMTSGQLRYTNTSGLLVPGYCPDCGAMPHGLGPLVMQHREGCSYVCPGCPNGYG